MDSLRWILLAIGILVIAAIYLIDRIKRNRRRRAADRFFEQDDGAGLSMTPRPGDDSDALADLGQLLRGADQTATQTTSTRRRSAVGEILRRQTEETDFELPELRHDFEPETGTDNTQPGDAGAVAIDDIEPVDAASDAGATAAVVKPERLLVMYLRARNDIGMYGIRLQATMRDLHLSLGSMGIYHDLDHDGRLVFSVANMHEPGTLDMPDPATFTTHGLALFMQLPGPVDEQAAFDRMLSKAETLAASLDANLEDDRHKLLSDASIERYRRQLVTVDD